MNCSLVSGSRSERLQRRFSHEGAVHGTTAVHTPPPSSPQPAELTVRGNKTKKMSHTVTVTRTLTTTTSTAIIINSGYLKTVPGILKLLEVIIGAVALGLFSWFYDRYYYSGVQETFFFCAITAVFVGTFCLFLSCIISFSTAAVIAKTIFEFIYHLFAFMLIGAASIALMIDLKDRSSRSHNYQPYFIACICGLILTVLYLITTIFAYRSYKGRV